MSERITIDIGAQYVGGTVRLAVLGAGADDAGPYALVAIGSHPNSTIVRLRVGVPNPLPEGKTLRLAAFAPTGHRPGVALEIADAGADGGAGTGATP